MAAVGTARFLGNFVVFEGTNGTNDADICIETGDVSRYDTFMVSNTAGAVDVEANDGKKWLTTAPLSLSDLGAASVNPVIVTTALRQYAFKGSYHKIRVRQKGATAATNVILRASMSER